MPEEIEPLVCNCRHQECVEGPVPDVGDCAGCAGCPDCKNSTQCRCCSRSCFLTCYAD